MGICYDEKIIGVRAIYLDDDEDIQILFEEYYEELDYEKKELIKDYFNTLNKNNLDFYFFQLLVENTIMEKSKSWRTISSKEFIDYIFA